MKRQRHELWGFGVVGWVSLGVLVALVFAMVFGGDLRLELLVLITDLFGIDATILFVTRIISYSWLAFSTPEISLLSLCLCWPALHLASRTTHRYWVIGLLLLCVLGPHISVEVYMALSRYWTAPSFVVAFWSIIILQIAVNLLASAIVYGITRRIWVAGVWAIASGLIAIQIYVGDFSVISLDGAVGLTVFGILYHAVTAGSLYIWAIRSRRVSKVITPCESCGYELAGLPIAKVCPECGAEITPAS